MEVTAQEIKDGFVAVNKAFEEFKSTNDARLKALETRGSADALFEAKLKKIGEELDKFEGMNAEVVKQLQLQKSLQEQVDRMETALNRTPGNTLDDQAKAASKKAFEKFARKGADALTADERKSLSASDDTTGGYFTPPEYVQEITKSIILVSPVRTMVRVRTTGARSVMAPKRTGTFAAVWIGETDTRNETTGLAYGMEEIPTHELTAEAWISMQDLEDSLFDLEAELNSEFAEQFGVAEGAAVVAGNAVKKPEGWMTNAAIASDVSGSAASIADANGQANGIITMTYNLKTGYANTASFAMQRATLGAVRLLQDAQKRYIWMPGVPSQPGIAPAQPNTILGYPYVEVPDMPAIGASTYPIAFGDFRRAYTMVDRVQMSVLRDPFTKSSQGLVRFVARKRVGGQVMLVEALRKLQCHT